MKKSDVLVALALPLANSVSALSRTIMALHDSSIEEFDVASVQSMMQTCGSVVHQSIASESTGEIKAEIKVADKPKTTRKQNVKPKEPVAEPEEPKEPVAESEEPVAEPEEPKEPVAETKEEADETDFDAPEKSLDDKLTETAAKVRDYAQHHKDDKDDIAAFLKEISGQSRIGKLNEFQHNQFVKWLSDNYGIK